MSIAVGDSVIHGVSRRDSLPRLVKLLTLLVVVFVVLAGWKNVAPTAFGGKNSYVVTTGSSMLPGYVPGSLVVTRARAEYEVGDVVAYFNGRMNAVILHRIVALDGSQFVFQGDNNDFVDPYRPSRSELVGEAVVYLPKVGHVVARLQDPAMFGVLVGAIALFSLRLPRAKRRASHRGRKKA